MEFKRWLRLILFFTIWDIRYLLNCLFYKLKGLKGRKTDKFIANKKKGLLELKFSLVCGFKMMGCSRASSLCLREFNCVERVSIYLSERVSMSKIFSPPSKRRVEIGKLKVFSSRGNFIFSLLFLLILE